MSVQVTQWYANYIECAWAATKTCIYTSFCDINNRIDETHKNKTTKRGGLYFKYLYSDIAHQIMERVYLIKLYDARWNGCIYNAQSYCIVRCAIQHGWFSKLGWLKFCCIIFIVAISMNSLWLFVIHIAPFGVRICLIKSYAMHNLAQCRLKYKDI